MNQVESCLEDILEMNEKHSLVAHLFYLSRVREIITLFINLIFLFLVLVIG